MKSYRPDKPAFSDTIMVTETTDPAHPDNVNAAAIQLIQNDVIMSQELAQAKAELEECNRILDDLIHGGTLTARVETESGDTLTTEAEEELLLEIKL